MKKYLYIIHLLLVSNNCMGSDSEDYSGESIDRCNVLGSLGLNYGQSDSDDYGWDQSSLHADGIILDPSDIEKEKEKFLKGQLIDPATQDPLDEMTFGPTSQVPAAVPISHDQEEFEHYQEVSSSRSSSSERKDDVEEKETVKHLKKKLAQEGRKAASLRKKKNEAELLAAELQLQVEGLNRLNEALRLQSAEILKKYDNERALVEYLGTENAVKDLQIADLKAEVERLKRQASLVSNKTGVEMSNPAAVKSDQKKKQLYYKKKSNGIRTKQADGASYFN